MLLGSTNVAINIPQVIKTTILGKLRRRNTVTPWIKPTHTRAVEITSLTAVGSSRPWPMANSSMNCPSSNHSFRTTRMSCRMAAAAGGSCRPLTVPPSCHLIAPSGCCVASRLTIVSSSCCPLTAPPSRCLAPAGCCVASRCAALSSSHCAALLSSHCAPASCCVAPSNAVTAIERPPHCRHCMPSSLFTATAATAATAAATCVVKRFTLVH